MLMKLHLIQRVTDHRVLVVDQPQSGDVHVVMTEIFQVQSLQILRQTTVLLQNFDKYKRAKDVGILITISLRVLNILSPFCHIAQTINDDALHTLR